MGFFDTLRRVLSGDQSPVAPAPAGLRPVGAAGGDEPLDYDRQQWRKKLKRVLEDLPGTRAEWADMMSEARALGFDPGWVRHCQDEEFQLLVRRAVSDRAFTEEEHRKLDLARDLIGIPEAEAEAILAGDRRRGRDRSSASRSRGS